VFNLIIIGFIIARFSAASLYPLESYEPTVKQKFEFTFCVVGCDAEY
jgi:hypothetical protein